MGIQCHAAHNVLHVKKYFIELENIEMRIRRYFILTASNKSVIKFLILLPCLNCQFKKVFTTCK